MRNGILAAGLLCLVAGQSAAAPVLMIALDKSKVIYDDGDTIEYPFPADSGVKMEEGKTSRELRLLGYDTPETMHPHHGIFYHQPLGPEASARLKKLIGAAKKLEVLTAGESDKYGRLLAHLLIDGVPSGALMIKAGLAYETISHYGDNGFSEQSRQILEAWNSRKKKPATADPHLWRKANQRHEKAIPLEIWNSLNEAERAKAVEEVRKLSTKSI